MIRTSSLAIPLIGQLRYYQNSCFRNNMLKFLSIFILLLCPILVLLCMLNDEKLSLFLVQYSCVKTSVWEDECIRHVHQDVYTKRRHCLRFVMVPRSFAETSFRVSCFAFTHISQANRVQRKFSVKVILLQVKG